MDLQLNKWYNVTSREEADKLIYYVGHDSYIIDFNYVGGCKGGPNVSYKTRLTIETQKYKAVLEFSGEVTVHYVFDDGPNFIYLASIVFGDDCVYWVEGDDDYRLCDIKDDSLYFCAKKLRWKLMEKKF